MAYQSYPYNSAPSYSLPQSAGPSQPYYPPPQHYQQPPPPNPHDPFRAYYSDRLRELTFNSRPLIQELSMLAMQQRDSNHWANMTAVVEEIEGAVYRSPAHEKLPKLYLLDSISKNVGAPYTTHLLQATVPRLYIRTYREVDGVTKVKMEEMIGLWRRPGLDGGELYGPAAREAVEREIFGGLGSGGQRMHAPLPLAREIVTRESVSGAIHSMIGVKQGEAAQRVWDRGVQTQLTALMGLSEMVNTRHVQPAELQQIMDQLRGMGYQVPQSNGYPPPRTVLPPYPPAPVPVQQSYPAPIPAPALPPFAPTMHTPSFDQQRSTPPYSAPPPAAISQPLPAPVAPPAPLFDANMLSILNSLTGSGALSLPKAEAKPVPAPVVRSKLDDYENMVIGLNLSLTNLDMNRMSTLPLDHLPIQCSQCSARFPSDGEALNAHMDWHVRRNKQERTSSGRGAHRRWLPRAEEWVNDIPVAGSSTAPDTIAGAAAASDAGGANAIAKATKTAEELQKKWVRVPSGPQSASAVCPVCKEGFKREWSEDEEEWVWRNAIDVSGKIMHATCRQQQLTANRLARVSKGRSGSAGTSSKSPGLTPEAEPVSAVKGEPHPLSHVLNAGQESEESTQVEAPVVEEEQNGETAKTVEGEPTVNIKEEKAEELPGTTVPQEVEEMKVDTVEGGTAVKRKADEETEEERKRVKVEEPEHLEQTIQEVLPESEVQTEVAVGE